MKNITRTVWILSLVSLFTDAASEMLYPVMPVYLKSIGFSVLFIGILEGIAEAVAGLGKGYFGKLSDHQGKRVPFVRAGYALSAISKPMMGLFVFPVWIFMSRTIDRIGKGIRTGARDALLSDEATPETKGTIFGFHRAMDTMGAVIGPLLALVYLYYYPGNYRMLFFIAFIPGIIAMFTSGFLKDKNKPTKTSPLSLSLSHSLSHSDSPSLFSFIHYWKQSPPEYRKLVSGLLAFTLINSSDVFLLLKAKESGLSDQWVIGIYIFYNLVYAISSFPLGIIADKTGLKKMYLIGLALFAVVYLGMGLTQNGYIIGGLFFLYGIYAAATEGISKAWISNISSTKDTATAIGTYSGFQSICSIFASSFAGFIWYTFGASSTFMITGLATLLIMGYFLTQFHPNRTREIL